MAEWDAVVSHAGCLQAMQALEICFAAKHAAPCCFFEGFEFYPVRFYVKCTNVFVETKLALEGAEVATQT